MYVKTRKQSVENLLAHVAFIVSRSMRMLTKPSKRIKDGKIKRKSEKIVYIKEKEGKTFEMISVSNHEFVELRHQQPQCKTHFVFTDIDIADLDIPEISSAKYQLKNGNAIGAYKKDGSSSSIASTKNNKGKKIVAIGSVLLALILLGAGEMIVRCYFY
jgi:hypothetical protein